MFPIFIPTFSLICTIQLDIFIKALIIIPKTDQEFQIFPEQGTIKLAGLSASIRIISLMPYPRWIIGTRHRTRLNDPPAR